MTKAEQGTNAVRIVNSDEKIGKWKSCANEVIAKHGRELAQVWSTCRIWTY
jgi:hypothetical protein